MSTSITFNTDVALKTLIEANAAKSHTSVSDYLTTLIRQVFSHDDTTQPREISLSENVSKYMGIVKDADDDWKEARSEQLNDKYGI